MSSATVKLQKQLVDLLTTLREQDGKVLPIDTISAKVGFNLNESAELREMWTTCDRIGFDLDAKTIWFKHDITVRSKQDVLDMVRANVGKGCVDVRSLKETFPEVIAAVKELEEEGLVLLIRNKDETPKLVYYNSMPFLRDKKTRPYYPSSTEFHPYWHKVTVPSEEDLKKELDKVGLKTTDSSITKIVPKNIAKKAKRQGRKIKLTNTHLEGVDLTKDPTTLRK
ncbi:hypothetical protein HDU76_000961 [Blyttiomyces sp. JEL0837]|nr:hypothetical protein HDU76_000961 [Blyttiomyces sp. JEL0837]